MNDQQERVRDGGGHGHGPYRVCGQVLHETTTSAAQKVLGEAHAPPLLLLLDEPLLAEPGDDR